jgi:geranylgeranyl diphosphate synthase type II
MSSTPATPANSATAAQDLAGQAAPEVLSVINAHLKGVASTVEGPASLREAITYALLGPGKRIRPLLAWHCCVAAGGQGQQALPAAAAVELVHAFSLVHDDLPAMDDDDLRRGRPTLHRHTSEAMAILAGDGMLTMAFGVLLGQVADQQVAARLCHELARGTHAMIAGQVWDTLGGLPPGLSPAEELELIHQHKTGALLVSACRCGAICAGASERALACVTAYARSAGLMFQVVDDVLDVTQPSEHVGKKTGKDQAKGKRTYPGVLGLEASIARAKALCDEAIQAVRPLGQPAEPLVELARFMAHRTK